MIDFIYNAPTMVVFSRDSEKETGNLLKKRGAKKVLVVYGEKSAKESGLLDRVLETIKEAGIEWLELGGVVPNPLLSLAYKGIELCKAEGVDFILAIGGGSAIDTAKSIAYGAVTETDLWDLFEQKAEPTGSLPVGAVLTIAAAGSEMSNSCVLTNDETHEKRGIGSEYGRCSFAVMNPALTVTVSPYQTAAGCCDIVMHTLERYFTPEEPMVVTEGLAESLLRNVMTYSRILTRRQDDYEARAEIMWAGALSHNGLMEAGGGRGDWACHQLAHELSAKYDLTHGAALTAVWSSWARYVYEENVARFAQLAENVLELEPEKDDDKQALAGIEEMESFFWSMEMPTTIAEAGIELSDEDIEELAARCTHYGERTIGAFKVLEKDDISNIYANARG